VAGALLIHAAGWLTVAVALSGPIDARRARLLWLLGADDRAVRRTPVTAGALSALAVAAIALVSARAGWQWLSQELTSVGRLYASAVRLQWPPEQWACGFRPGGAGDRAADRISPRAASTEEDPADARRLG